MDKKLIPALLIVGGVVIVAALGLWVTHYYKYGREKPAPPGPRVANVIVETVRALPELPDVAELPAVIEPQRTVTVSAEVAGRVEKLAVKEGAACRAGQLLIVLNSDLLEAQRDGARARAKLAELAFLRTEKLQKAGAARGEELETARAARDASAAALAAAEARLKRARITAPIAGVLDDFIVEKGEYVTAGNPVARIVDSSRVKAAVMIPERDAQYIKVGTPADVLCELEGKKRVFHGKVSYLSLLADRATRAARAEVTVDNPKRLLRGGRIVTVRLTRRVLKDAVMVPLDAVIPLERGHAVYVVESGKAVRREVRLDTSVIKSRKTRKTRKKVQYVRILEGLKPGEQLIVKGQAFVGSGQPVHIETQEKTPGAAAE